MKTDDLIIPPNSPAGLSEKNYQIIPHHEHGWQIIDKANNKSIMRNSVRGYDTMEDVWERLSYVRDSLEEARDNNLPYYVSCLVKYWYVRKISDNSIIKAFSDNGYKGDKNRKLALAKCRELNNYYKLNKGVMSADNLNF